MWTIRIVSARPANGDEGMKRFFRALGVMAGISAFLGAGANGAHAAVRDLAGDWRGMLTLRQGISLPVVLHLAAQGDILTATMDSPAQGAFHIPVETVRLDNQTLTLTLPRLSARYVAKIRDDNRTLDGEWSQRNNSLPLIMTHGAAEEVQKRPQIPKPPFPYRSEEVSFDNPSGPAHLAGTLTLPQGKGPFPAVLLITGSGLQDRDETAFGHRPFLVWADTLTRKGIAVLRVDDRMRGGSTGPVESATTRDFAQDTEAGLRFLRSHSAIDPTRIGLMGHSEGGMIASMIAAHDPGVTFIVLLEAPPVPGRPIMLAQRDWAMKQSQVPQAVARESDRDFIAVMDAMTPDQSQKEADQAADSAWNKIKGTKTGLPADMRIVTMPAIRFMDRYDPASDLARVRCPVLAVIGSKDRQVPADIALPAFHRALAANHQAQIVELPGLNHLLQKAETGSSGEYSLIEEDIDASALDLVSDWLKAQLHP
ncbi:alpha/beta hydrolase [Asaia sp. W19]|nr:alpha/beta hydrolase [Asaia sp. W19]